MKKFQLIYKDENKEIDKVLGTYDTMTDVQKARLDYETNGTYNAKFFKVKEVWATASKKYKIVLDKPGQDEKVLFVTRDAKAADEKMDSYSIKFHPDSFWIELRVEDDFIYEAYLNQDQQKREEIRSSRRYENRGVVDDFTESLAKFIGALVGLILLIVFYKK